MGRKPTVNHNLPKGMRARKRGEITYFYYDTGGRPRKEIPLGKDYISAVQQWSKLEMEKLPAEAKVSFTMVSARYELEVISKKAAKTQEDNVFQLKNLNKFFGGENPAPLDEIQAEHIRQYLAWRKDAPVAANREIALLSHIWTMCGPGQWDYTDKPNPTKGVTRHKEKPRDIYIEDYLYEILYECADQDLQDAMEIAYMIGQRPADTLKITTHHIRDGVLSIIQNKTQAKLRFAISERLQSILDRRIINAKPYLFSHNNGKQIAVKTISKRFHSARQRAIDLHPELKKELLACQFRDLRAKSGTDAFLKSDSVESAQKQLGHTSADMTRRYIRRDKILTPLD